MLKKIPLIWLWRSLLVVLCFALLGNLAWRYYGVGGTFNLSYNFTSADQLITPFEPHGRALDLEQNVDSGDYYQRIVAEPVYFSAHLPSAYPSVDVTIEYQNPSQKIVTLGIQTTDIYPYNFVFQPLENKFADTTTWPQLTNGKYNLYQRNPTYSSVDDFLANPPTNHHVGTYFSPSHLPFIDSTYLANETGFDTTVPLIGQQDLVTYIKDEDLHITFNYEAKLIDTPVSPVTIQVMHLGKLIQEQSWADVSAGSHEASLTVPTLPEGVYDILFITTDATVINHIGSSQHKMVFRNTVHLGTSAIPTSLYSNSNNLTVIPEQLEALGNIQMYNSILHLTHVNTPAEWQNPIPNYPFTIPVPNNNTTVIGDAALALNQANWFDPSFGFRALAQNTPTDSLDDILTAQYTAPDKLRGWTTVTTTFDLTKVQRINPAKLDFMVSAPGVDSAAQGIKVRSITITAHKPALTWSTLWSRLKAKL